MLDGELVAGKQKEIKEAKNAYEAYDKIMTLGPYTVKDLPKAHRLMTQGLIRDAGKFRSGDAGVFDGDAVIHLSARSQFVPELITGLFGWAKNSELHPTPRSAMLHYGIKIIHPLRMATGV